jgi:CRP-like cAMP-binding protein
MDPVFDRSVIPANKVFIKANEEKSRAYVIQTGQVRSYIIDENDEKIEIARYGEGTIIGEVCLVIDDPIPMYYEAVESSTVITITRQDFEKKFAKADNVIQTILEHLAEKLKAQDSKALEDALANPEIDPTAQKMVDHLVGGLSEERKAVYSKALIPHVDGMLKAIGFMKEEEKRGKPL